MDKGFRSDRFSPRFNRLFARPAILAREGKWLLAGGLVAATLAAHLLTQGSGATPAIPVPPGGSGIDFAAPGGGSVSFTGQLDRQAVLQGGDGRVKMELVLAAEERADPGSSRVPTDFVVVLDRSGSMDGAKIEHARAAVRELISQLAPDDRFAVVSYASGSEMTIPLAPATAGARQRWRGTVAGIRPGGGTNMSSGLEQAVLITAGPREGRAGRLILISDGLANEGDPTVEGLSRRAAMASRHEVAVSTVGVGADFNEFLMSAVADAGTGNYYYLNDVERLAQVFSDELGATRETVASALAVAVAPGDGVEVIDAAGYPLERMDGKTVFRPGSLFSGQERRIWVTLKVANRALGDRSLGSFTASFKDGGVTHVLEFDDPPMVACVADEHSYHQSFDKETWARSVAEEDYGRLQQKDSKFVKSGRRDEALREINAYQVENERLNLHMKQEAITQKLEKLKRLESEVEDSFKGANQADKRNSLSKMNQAAGRDVRRIGSKKGSAKAKGGR